MLLKFILLFFSGCEQPQSLFVLCCNGRAFHGLTKNQVAINNSSVGFQEANVVFNTIPPESQEDASHCPVIEQKEFDSGKSDESCGKETHEGNAGLCT